MLMSEQLSMAATRYAYHAVSRPTVELVLQVVNTYDDLKKMELQKRTM